MNDFYNKIDFGKTDLFEKFREIYNLKMEILNKYPAITKFTEAVYMDSSPEAIEIKNRKNEIIIKESMVRLFSNVDTSMFRENLEVQKAINIILWSLEGLGNSELKKAKLTNSHLDYNEILKEIEVYLELFKQCFYK